jgi:hypothetical protein
MRNKLLTIALLSALSLPATAEAHIHPIVAAVPATGGEGLGLVYMLPSLGFGTFVMYANATGIPFPACGVAGLKCYGEYPHDPKYVATPVAYEVPNSEKYTYMDKDGVHPYPGQVHRNGV